MHNNRRNLEHVFLRTFGLLALIAFTCVATVATMHEQLNASVVGWTWVVATLITVMRAWDGEVRNTSARARRDAFNLRIGSLSSGVRTPNRPANRELFPPKLRKAEYSVLTPGDLIYVLQDVEVTGYCKIGMTRKALKRMRTFGIQLPFCTELVHFAYVQNAFLSEAELHRMFASKRVRGEWFDLSAEDINAIKEFLANERSMR